MQILVTGASGFVGRSLVLALVDAGHEVRAMTRRPEVYDGTGEPVFGDVDNLDSLPAALAGCDVAYYLVHSLNHRDFVTRDAAAARGFGDLAAAAGVRRIVYLGGLGDPDDRLSAHLRSRQECEGLLGLGGVPVSTLRAGIIIGHRGASWEIIHNLVGKLPALTVPQWGRTLTQPIALSDMVRYLVGVLDVDDRETYTFEVGGADVLRYSDMLSRVSVLEGRTSIFLPIWLPGGTRPAARAAAEALPLLTGVDRHTVRALIESMKNEVVVRDDLVRSVVLFEPMGYDDAVLAALRDSAQDKLRDSAQDKLRNSAQDKVRNSAADELRR
ncbi:NAD(P)H-binding protein [uncultured Jatrophihabitans sp.]|uniref:NAD(P)H-binding protein n=1 Tax=uncultured Jatrophihabitans sp. TaxID=1610747 RepID=UPI0035CA6B04